MKKRLLLLLAVCAAVILPSCQNDKDDPVIDSVAPIILKVQVHNRAGENLLDADVKGNILDKRLQLRIWGENLEVQLTKPAGVDSQSKKPQWYGAYIDSPFDNGTNREIIIGEFYGARNYSQRMNLYLDGVVHELAFKNEFYREGNKTTRRCTFYLDGEELWPLDGGGSSLYCGYFSITLDR